MKAYWTVNAIGHLTEIFEFIGRDSRRYAQLTVERITGRVKQVQVFPTSGQIVPEFRDPAIREVLEGSYRIVYRIEVNRIAVLAVIHGARLMNHDILE